MGIKNIYERFIWFDDQVKLKKYPNATSLPKRLEVSLKTAQRDVKFMRERLTGILESLKPLLRFTGGELLQ
jgi:hypothetical protein